jgi:aspartyl-tRNA(Asn)/glutamyl-tRNA(Gln) amidotransferase subunit A
MLLQQIAGYDHLDIDCADRPVPDYSAGIGAPVAQFRLGMPAQFYDHLDDDVASVIDEAISLLNKMTKGSHEVGLPSLLRAGINAEIAAYHENLRGVNGGGYEPSTARVFPAGQDTTRAADYIRGWRELTMVRRTVDEDVFQKQNVDLLIAPSARHTPAMIEEELTPAGAGGAGGGGRGGRGGATVAPAAGGGGDAGVATRRAQGDPEDNTRPFNGYGLPTITVPCGFSKDGMPIGLQIAGPHFGEINVLALAYAYQEATEWHKRRPALQPDTKVPVLSKTAAEQTGG